MSENKSSISNESSNPNIAEYRDSPDPSEIEQLSEEVNFEVEVRSEVFYYPVENSLSFKINSIAAKKKEFLTEALVNLWLAEKVDQETK